MASRAASLIRARSAIEISCPVGLFGVLRKIIRVRGVIALITLSVGKLRSGFAGTRTDVAPAAAVELGYGSKAGVGTIVSASCMRAFEMWPIAAIRIPSSRPLVSSTHSGFTLKYPAIVSTRLGYDG